MTFHRVVVALVFAFAVMFYRFAKVPNVFKNDDFVNKFNGGSGDVNGSKNTVAEVQYISMEPLHLEARKVEKVQDILFIFYYSFLFFQKYNTSNSILTS